jgi:thioesterase domain-containing protein/NAD(P)-dependent dehydrogenase (short-subunit alcohol dehydrogenase family)/acyl carrier protein
VIPRELPHVRARAIDVALGAGAALDDVAGRLARELESAAWEPRGGAARRPSAGRRLEPLRLDAIDGGAPAVRPGSTVLVTGGLGGIGLELALHLARTARVKLVLVGRRAVPPRAEWAACLAQAGPDDPLAARLGKLLAIEATGAECLTLAADVADPAAAHAVVAAARRRFGAVHAVVHAAGVLDDGLIATKSAAAASAVLRPKARGALVLERALRGEPLEAFVMFSSVSAVLGLEGQVDYTAANAFLDAFAERLRARGVRAVSIAWNAWQQVGMAAALADAGDGADRRANAPVSASGPEATGSTTESTTFDALTDWRLSEHVVRGAEAVLPGTGYLSLAGAAAARALGADGGAVELRDVTFLAPFAVRAGEPRELQLQLVPAGDGGVRFAFASAAQAEPHVVGRAARATAPAGPPVRLDDVAPRLARRVEVGGWLDQPFVRFGPRWANIERVLYGDGEAAVCLTLPDAFVGDLAEHWLHPALLDMATGAAQALIPNFDQAADFFVPLAYGRLTRYAPLPQRLWSHVRHRPTASPALASFDVTLHDPDGRVLVEVVDFRMKRIADAGVMAGRARAGAATAGGGGRRIDEAVRLGIAPAEGMEAFDRVLGHELRGHVIASSVDVTAWRARLDAAPAGAAGSGAERPNLATDYAAPRTPIEAALAEVWTELLGVARVGVHDDFFDLGGQSLVAVRMFARVRGRFDVDLPLSTLFEAPTIAKLAAVVAAEAGLDVDVGRGTRALDAGDAAPTAPARPAGEGPAGGGRAPQGRAPSPARGGARRARWRSLVAMQRDGDESPLYVWRHGRHAHNLRALALAMGRTRPVYGLQPPGADDRREILYSVEELAARYVAEVRAVQPRGPYFLGGYSGGGVAAFEMARQLTAAGEQVAFLGFIDSFSRRCRDGRGGGVPGSIWRARAHRGAPTCSPPPVDATRTSAVRWRSASATRSAPCSRSATGTRASRSRGSCRGALQPARWDGRATLFRAREETAISLWTAFEVDEAHGWRRFLAGVDVELCPGNHQTMCEEPHVRTLAARVRAAVDAASAVDAGVAR